MNEISNKSLQYEFPISTHDLKKLVVLLYKLNRSHFRLLKTLTLFAESIGKKKQLELALFKTLHEEKKHLADIINKQLNYLYELGSPGHILASKKLEKEAAEETIGEIKMKSASQLYKQELLKLEKLIMQENFDLSNDFVTESDWMINLAGTDGDDDELKFELIKT